MEELIKDEIEPIKEKVGVISAYWDYFHKGHEFFIEECFKIVNKLIVLLIEDLTEFEKKIKPSYIYMQKLNERDLSAKEFYEKIGKTKNVETIIVKDIKEVMNWAIENSDKYDYYILSEKDVNDGYINAFKAKATTKAKREDKYRGEVKITKQLLKEDGKPYGSEELRQQIAEKIKIELEKDN